MADAREQEQGEHGRGETHRLLCEHRWVPGAGGGAHRCVSCGLGYAEYVEGSVRGALSRMGAWD